MRWLKIVHGLVAALMLATPAAAQQPYPSKPIRVIVPFSPGGSPDISARAVAAQLQRSLGQAVVVENRPGANGTTGARAVTMAAPDGYTLLLANSTFATNASSRKNLPYDSVKDFAPVAGIARSAGSLMVVSTKSSIRTPAEFISEARQSKLFFGSSGLGNSTHLMGALFAAKAGITMGHLPYSGAAQALHAVIRGEVHTAYMSPAAAAGMVKAGDLRAIGFTGDSPYPDYPDALVLSTVVPGYRISGAWAGLLAPRGTPAEIVALLNSEIRKAANAPVVANFLRKGGATPDDSTPAAFAAFVKEEIERWAEAFRATGMEQQ
jgi:tripartite-type tricarboxylate transporter receptor subunit TctC